MNRPLACPEKMDETTSLTAGNGQAWPDAAVSTGVAALALFCIVLLALLNGCGAPVSSLLPAESVPAGRTSAPEFTGDAPHAAERHPSEGDAADRGQAAGNVKERDRIAEMFREGKTYTLAVRLAG